MMTTSNGLELNSVEVGGWIRILYFLKNLPNLNHNSILKYFQWALEEANRCLDIKLLHNIVMVVAGIFV